MSAPEVILGPPGCGKTSALLTRLDAEIAGGVHPAQVAFVAFTRAARMEVWARVQCDFGYEPRQCPWFRTIHSAAHALIGLAPGSILTDKHLGEFAKLYGYELTNPGVAHNSLDGDPTSVPTESDDDRIRYVHEWARNRRIPLERALALCRVEGVTPTQLELFSHRLAAFKTARGVCDFTDLLEEVLRRGLRPPVSVAFVDEAQDLSPLQIAVVEQWFRGCQRWYVAGDDDQAIYAFQGADPAWLLELSAAATPTVLQQSRRVPVAVQVLAERIIRQNTRRVAKTYLPTNRTGTIAQLNPQAALGLVDGQVPTFILARNRRALLPYAYQLRDRAIPYVVEGPGAPSPLSDKRLATAVTVAGTLTAGRAVIGADLAALLSFIHPDSGLFPRGLKSQLARAREAGTVYSIDEVRRELGLGALVDAIERVGPIQILDRLPAATLLYLQCILRADGTLPEPRVRLTSIHGSKGREAELVLLVSDMSRATYDEYTRGGVEGRESENRVFYVGVTRTKETLVLVQPNGRRHFEFPALVTEPTARHAVHAPPAVPQGSQFCGNARSSVTARAEASDA